VAVKYLMETPSASKNSTKSIGVLKKGLATNWLERLWEAREKKMMEDPVSVYHLPKFHLPIYIRTSNFRLPKDLMTPIIMIGPGTGVAPMRGFIRERYQESLMGNNVGTTWLFFGCRYKDQDFLYNDEFEEIKLQIKEQGLAFDFRLTTAFSREGKQKVYVQHRLAQERENIWELLDKQNGHIYVCGDAKRMASDVSKELEKMAMEIGKMSQQAAAKYFKGLRTKGRYQEDVWA
jgi:NADPH-ferrihemoprotein reductase